MGHEFLEIRLPLTEIIVDVNRGDVLPAGRATLEKRSCLRPATPAQASASPPSNSRSLMTSINSKATVDCRAHYRAGPGFFLGMMILGAW